ncbi:hypothetical protein I302_102565 [Kwoniella bestiolae CBS 10118]|uniref:Uncharacterized protein n=1 Tax=Kwoniella bestiolae CBS 10118 TaxID=1296100 RepID=A0A1B9GFG4_9TREE|nr:hypothetical protein I302_01251 [Kwoniella bestiolae CBS 10118]OCF29738.1 hypothetical protein I302_01251 [Kwoniella bestiolae CBS 10118]
MNTFDLSHIGAELDASRRHRAIPLSRQGPEEEQGMDIPGLSTSIGSETSITIEEVPDDQLEGSSKTKSQDGAVVEERPYPLCLLCLSRPPSAVLLPCCHLNLCYLCAPLLIHRSTNPTFPSSASTPISTQIPQPSSSPLEPIAESNPPPITSSNQTLSECPKIPYNQLLYKATLNHPNARKLGLGGYRPPAQDQVGGEYTSEGVLGLGTSKENAMMDGIMEDGRISLKDSSDDHGAIFMGRDVGGAKCLVCRAGVKGWLRVYTG